MYLWDIHHPSNKKSPNALTEDEKSRKGFSPQDSIPPTNSAGTDDSLKSFNSSPGGQKQDFISPFQKRSPNWSEQECTFFIKLYRQELSKMSTNPSAAWTRVVSKLNATFCLSQKRTISQCKQKLRDLKKAYRRTAYFSESDPSPKKVPKWQSGRIDFMKDLSQIFEPSDTCSFVSSEYAKGASFSIHNENYRKKDIENQLTQLHSFPDSCQKSIPEKGQNSSKKPVLIKDIQALHEIAGYLIEWERTSWQHHQERIALYEYLIKGLTKNQKKHPT